MHPDEPVLSPTAKIIPLTAGPALSQAGRREELRAAVRQVVEHLVIRAVPPPARSPYFDQAQSLLETAGLGLDELLDVAENEQVRRRLLETLGLAEGDR